MNELTMPALEGLVGETFAVNTGGAACVELVLAELQEAPERRRRDHRGDLKLESFSLLFEGPRDAALSQGTYTFRHPALGEHLLFMCPVVPHNSDRLAYEVIINRVLP